MGRFVHRPALTVESFGDESREYLLANAFVPEDLRDAWTAAADLALQQVRRIRATVGETATLRLHGDCHGGNVLWTDDGPHFVDFDDARTGPAVQDLWMLLSGDRAAMEEQLGVLLRGYESFRDFDRRELALIEALRTLRLLHYSAWLARRWRRSRVPRRISLVQHPALLAGPDSRVARADRADGRAAARGRARLRLRPAALAASGPAPDPARIASRGGPPMLIDLDQTIARCPAQRRSRMEK